MLLQKHANVVDLIPAPRQVEVPLEVLLEPQPSEPDQHVSRTPSTRGRRVALAVYVLVTAAVAAGAVATHEPPPPAAPVAPAYPTPEEPLMRAVFR